MRPLCDAACTDRRPSAARTQSLLMAGDMHLRACACSQLGIATSDRRSTTSLGIHKLSSHELHLKFCKGGKRQVHIWMTC